MSREDFESRKERSDGSGPSASPLTLKQTAQRRAWGPQIDETTPTDNQKDKVHREIYHNKESSAYAMKVGFLV